MTAAGNLVGAVGNIVFHHYTAREIPNEYCIGFEAFDLFESP